MCLRLASLTWVGAQAEGHVACTLICSKIYPRVQLIAQSLVESAGYDQLDFLPRGVQPRVVEVVELATTQMSVGDTILSEK